MKNVVIGVLAIAVGGSQVFAAVTTYSDRATWESAIGGNPDYLVDFNDVSVDTSFLNTPYDAGPFSIVANMIGEDYIDTEPYHPGFSIDNTPHIHASIGPATSGEVVDMAFDSPIIAWAADFSELDYGGVNLILHTVTGTTTLPTIPDASTFFAFVTTTTDAVQRITFFADGSNGEDFGMDNIGIVIPEPTTLSLLALGTLLALKRRKYPRHRIACFLHGSLRLGGPFFISNVSN